LKPGVRTLLREGPLQRVSPDVKLRGFLFNDLILLVKEETKEKKTRFKLYVKPLLFWLIEVQGSESEKRTMKRNSKSSGKANSIKINKELQSHSGSLTTPIESGEISAEETRNFVLNDHGSNELYDLKAPSPRDKTLWLEDIGIAIKKLRHDLVVLVRLTQLQDPKGEPLDCNLCLKFGENFYVAAADGIYTAKGEGSTSFSRLGGFKKRVQQFQIVEKINKFITLEGKTNSLRLYNLNELETAGEKGDKIIETAGALHFHVGEVNGKILLVTFSNKLTIFEYENNAFVRKAEIIPPNLFCRHIEFLDQEIVAAFGSKFYSLNYLANPPRFNEVNLTEKQKLQQDQKTEPEAIMCFSMNGQKLFCFTDSGIWENNKGITMHWSAPAKAFARNKEFLFVFTTHFVEVWDWVNTQLVQAIRAPFIQSLNFFNTGQMQDLEMVDTCLAAVTYSQTAKFLCKLEVVK